MTTYHGGRRGMYGWMYVLLVFVLPFFGALAAREMRERRKRLLDSTIANAAAKPLKASAVVEQGDTTLRVEGGFRFTGSGYELKMREIVDGSISESCQTFTTLEQLEAFIVSSTALRLGDFRPA